MSSACPKCGQIMEPDARFCDQCLTPLVSAPAAGAAAITAVEQATSDEARGTAGLDQAILVGELPTSEDVLTDEQGERLADSSPADACGVSDCEDFRVEYNRMRVFLAGVQSTFNFRVTPISEGAKDCSNIRLMVHSHGYLSQPIDYRYPQLKTIRSGVSLPVAHLGLHPATAGMDIEGEVFFGYIKDGVERTFFQTFLWDAYPPNEAPSKVIENLSVRIGDIVPTVDRAGDQNVALNFLNGLSQKGISRADELQKLKMPAVYDELALFECDGWPGSEGHAATQLGPPRAQAISEKLTLSLPSGLLVHFLAMPQVQVGKKRECDVIARILERSGDALPERNQNLSRFHCRISNQGGKCILTDGDGKKKSMCGTYLDRVKLAPVGSETLPLNRVFKLSLAGADRSDPHALTFECRIWSCNSADKCFLGLHEECKPDNASCMVMGRTDDIPEKFVLLWRFCHLHVVESESEDMLVFRYKGAFAFRKHGQCGWLVPGQKVGELDVRKFKQFGESQWGSKH